MDLNFKSFGQGPPLVILHGLFGTLDNWQTLGKRWAEDFTVFLVDQRNHGRSPHADTIDYPEMAGDLKAFLEHNWIYGTHVLGHSMGGKTAMQFALDYPDMVDRLVVVDIAPRAYPGGHEAIFQALLGLDLDALGERGEADAILAERIPQRGIRQFLLKNLTRTKDGGYAWKMNLSAIHRHYPDILANIRPAAEPFAGPTLFIRGANSDYLADADWPAAQALFPAARLETVAGAGHWVHAERPEELYGLVDSFLKG